MKQKKLILFISIMMISSFLLLFFTSKKPNIDEYNDPQLNISHQFLTKNPYSRSGKSLDKINGIVIHYTANPKSTAQNNHDYFENLKNTHITKASSHFIIGLEGEIIQCIPLNEIAYASNNRNKDTISIECCHLDATRRQQPNLSIPTNTCQITYENISLKSK